MAINGITNTTGSAADSIASLISNGQNTSATTVARENGALGKDSFLQLLVTEMKYQDPLNPMSNKDSIAQLAQFSALEQMQNLNTSFNKFAASQGGAGDRAAMLGVLGMSVTGLDENGASKTGDVTKVSFTDGKTILSLHGGGTMDFDSVISVAVPSYG